MTGWVMQSQHVGEFKVGWRIYIYILYACVCVCAHAHVCVCGSREYRVRCELYPCDSRLKRWVGQCSSSWYQDVGMCAQVCGLFCKLIWSGVICVWTE